MGLGTCGEKERQTLHRCAAFTISLNFKKASYAAVASDGLTMLNMLLGTEEPVILLEPSKHYMARAVVTCAPFVEEE